MRLYAVLDPQLRSGKICFCLQLTAEGPSNYLSPACPEQSLGVILDNQLKLKLFSPT